MPELNGKKLYLMYRVASAMEGVEIDDWEELEPADRAAWERVARDVETKQFNIPDEPVV